MKIAIDISPLSNLNRVRGVGNYTKNLIENLNKIDKKNEYLYFVKGENIPPVDLIHYPYFDLFFHTLPIFKKSKTVVTVHDLIPLVFRENYPSGIKGKLKFQLQKLALHDVVAIITDSSNSQYDIEKYLGIAKNKIHVIYLAAEEIFEPIKDKKKLEKTQTKYCLPQKFLLYVGDVDFSKNLSKLIEAIHKVDTSLVLVGRAAKDESLPQTKILLAQIEKFNLGKRIFRLGFIEPKELVDIYNLAYAYIQPSLYEGFGLPLLEAMSCGCPVICSKVSSLPEVGGETALYVNPDSLENIVKTVGKTLTLSPLEYKKLQKKCLLQAGKFSWKKTAQETTRVYEKLISNT